MAGTSVAIDPNISVENWPFTALSTALEEYVALEDAALVQRLRTSGATLRGQTFMGELGLGLYRDTGGAAVSNGLVDLVIKTDTTGEVRMAAANSGCFGFKPSYGLVSRSGMIGLVPSMESCGMLAGEIKTISTALGCIAGGANPLDPSINKADIKKVLQDLEHWQDFQTRPITVGILGEQDNTAVEKLSRPGISVKKVSIKNLALTPMLHNIIGSVEASSSAGRFDSVRYGHRSSASTKNWNDMYINSRGEAFGPLVKAYLFQGGYFQYQNYSAFVDACRSRARLVQEVDEALGTVDLIILPPSAKLRSALDEPKSVADLYEAFSSTVLASLTGHPAIFIPGAPGLQLLGKRFGDARLLSLAARISNILKGEI
jgi:aspartyl-tRNA(Asn)/glutamyl-tRNA(Gln) amidotransferase subunit A